MIRRVAVSLILVPVLVPAAWAWASGHWNDMTGSFGDTFASITDRGPRVERIVDGDTIVLAGGERVRIIGINAPEIAKSATPAQCFGNEAKERLERLIPPGTSVALELGVEPRDKYGRTLAHVRVEGKLVSVLQARGGYAQALPIEPNMRYAPRINRAVSQAQEQGRGMWTACF